MKPSAFVRSQDGVETQKKVYEQLIELLEDIEPDIGRNI
jgi:hypothetical protein